MSSSFAQTIIAVPLTVANGGDGTAASPANCALLGQGTNPTSSMNIGTQGQICQDQGSGADPQMVTWITKNVYTSNNT